MHYTFRLGIACRLAIGLEIKVCFQRLTRWGITVGKDQNGWEEEGYFGGEIKLYSTCYYTSRGG